MTSGGNRQNMERRRELAKSCAIRCDRCRLHRGDNAGRKPKPDIGKNHRRGGR